MTRQSQHNRSWSPLNDAWSGLARLRLMLISLRDDHRTKPSRERARHPQCRSERAACSMQARYATGAGGALFAAWVAWHAVQRQIAIQQRVALIDLITFW